MPRVLIVVAVSRLARLDCIRLEMAILTRTEYRSAIFFHSPEQEKVAKEVTAEVQDK